MMCCGTLVRGAWWAVRFGLALLVVAVVLAWAGRAGGESSHWVKVTFYTDYGLTRSGTLTRPGVASCDPSYFPLGTVLLFELDGRVVTCEDTGSAVVGAVVDIWMPTLWSGYNAIEAVYWPSCNFGGGYTCAYVRVLRWGWPQ